MRPIRTLPAAAFLLACIAALPGCVDRAAQKQAKKTQEINSEQTIPVRVTKAWTTDLEETLEVTGAFATSEQSSVGPNVSGRLVAVYVRDGDTVRAGQVIAQVQTTDMYSRLQQAQAQADSARSALQQALNEARIGPTKTSASVRSAESRLAQAKARYEKAKNGSRSEERTQAEWNVKRAKSDMDTARLALDRAKRLYDEGAIAKVDVENAENRYQNTLAAYQGALESLSMTQSATRPEDLEAARQDVRAAEEALSLAKADKRLDVNHTDRVAGARANLTSAQQQVSLAQQSIAEASVRSPFNGRVSGKPLQAGTVVAPGIGVATIVGDGGTYFEASVPELKVASIPPGARTVLRVEALGGASVSGTVTAVNPVASGQGRLFSVRVSVNEQLGKVRPGMFAKGKIALGTRAGVVVVPNEAVLRDGEATSLFVVEGETAKKISVKTGLVIGNKTEVTGVQAGNQVVTTGQAGLVDGSKVKVQGS